MSRKGTSLTKAMRELQKAERAYLLAGMHEAVYCGRKRAGKPSVRAVLHEGDNVELVSSDEKALDGVYSALTSGRSEVSATKLRPVTEEELVKAMDSGQGERSPKLLGKGEE